MGADIGNHNSNLACCFEGEKKVLNDASSLVKTKGKELYERPGILRRAELERQWAYGSR